MQERSIFIFGNLKASRSRLNLCSVFWVGALNSFLRPIPMCFTLLVFNLNLVPKGREEKRPRDSENEVGPIFVRSAVKKMTGFEYESK